MRGRLQPSFNRRRLRRLAILTVAIFSVLPGVALAQAAPSFSLPVDCEIGKACVVQNYVDQDPGPAARDYRCGLLSYDDHKGTDIRVIDAGALERGVAVVAGAAGQVRGVRDGMPDISVRVHGKEAVAGREAGNSVVIEHGNGWETQYAHLRSGSLAVRPGETVHRGQRLGMVGLSGNTEFPHLHFEVRLHGKTVDPFVGTGEAEPCKAGADPLWRPEALNALAYVETGLLDAGIAGSPPGLDAGMVDRRKIVALRPGSSTVVFWVQIFGARQDDLEEFRLIAPDGTVISKRRSRILRNYAQWFAYTGKRRGEAGWPAGVFRGEYALYRGPQQARLLSVTREARVGE